MPGSQSGSFWKQILPFAVMVSDLIFEPVS